MKCLLKFAPNKAIHVLLMKCAAPSRACSQLMHKFSSLRMGFLSMRRLMHLRSLRAPPVTSCEFLSPLETRCGLVRNAGGSKVAQQVAEGLGALCVQVARSLSRIGSVGSLHRICNSMMRWQSIAFNLRMWMGLANRHLA